VLNPRAEFDLARRLRSASGAPLGETFAFLSGLYFRGKLTYARHFARPPRRGGPACGDGRLVITSNAGLTPADAIITADVLRAYGQTPIDPREPRYRTALERTAHDLRASMPANCEVVLLGSVATAKYVEPLVACFGDRLLFPREFVGRGDMSRGGLLLRAAAGGVELDYLPVVAAAQLTGQRPPKLDPATRPRRHPKKAN
ncbi:MAG TPA: hypothetical protein VEQ85_07480, partial [Lacipirellulaceae bacterium]|nr:hypothetical protein [Lacipirellulaceae bacterium]